MKKTGAERGSQDAGGNMKRNSRLVRAEIKYCETKMGSSRGRLDSRNFEEWFKEMEYPSHLATFAISTIVGTSRTRDFCDWLVASVAQVSKRLLRSMRPPLSLITGSSKRRFTIPLTPKVSWVTETPILPTRLPWSAAPKCEPSTELSEKLMGSGSAQLKSWDGLPAHQVLLIITRR